MDDDHGFAGTSDMLAACRDAAQQDVDPAEWNAEVELQREKHRLARVAAVERETAELEAREAAGRLPPSRRKRSNGVSSGFALRLSHAERTALEARADAVGLPPSVLARNLIRIGLTSADAQTDAVLDLIDSHLVELRALLGR